MKIWYLQLFLIFSEAELRNLSSSFRFLSHLECEPYIGSDFLLVFPIISAALRTIPAYILYVDIFYLWEVE